MNTFQISEPESATIHIYDSSKIIRKKIAENIADQTIADSCALVFCDMGEIIQRYTYLKKVMPRVEPYYAMKCCDERIVLETLTAIGSSFDCASPNEIDIVKELGVTPDRIIFANTVKPKTVIKYAKDENVDLMTFDCEDELLKIGEVYSSAKLVLRIKTDSTKAKYVLGKKFGCDPVNEAPNLLRKAKTLQLNVVGLSFHVGSLCSESEAYASAIAQCKCIFDIGTELGFNMSILDIGGGFSGIQCEDILSHANIINESLEKYFPDDNQVKVISEPGRYFVESAYMFVCNILTKKILDHENETNTSADSVPNNSKIQRMYYLNEGIFGLLANVQYEGFRTLPVPLKEIQNNSQVHMSTLWGPTGDSTDVVASALKLPDMKRGDWILFENIGAYSFPLKSNFNSLPQATVYLMIEKKLAPILKQSKLFSKYDFVEI